jgi:integrase
MRQISYAIRGRRSIPINDTIESIVENQIKANILLDGNILSMDNLIFKAPERGFIMAWSLDREIERICKACGIECFTMHAFRDTFATRCIEGGMNPKTLQEILGHSNFNITMSLYGHCLTDTKKQEMNKINIAI